MNFADIPWIKFFFLKLIPNFADFRWNYRILWNNHIILKFLFTTVWKRCIDWKSNPGTLTYKVNTLPLSYPGHQLVTIFSFRKPVRQTHFVYYEDISTEWATDFLSVIKKEFQHDQSQKITYFENCVLCMGLSIFRKIIAHFINHLQR